MNERRLGALLGLGVGQPEVERMPARLARDRLDDVRVDLGQRVVARDAAEGVRQPRADARVVECVPRLVEKRLVVGETSLRARDQVDDLGSVGCDHAGSRALLRPVLEVEADVRNRLESNPSSRTVSTHTSTERSLGYVDSSGDRRRSQRSCALDGSSPRSGPSSRSNQRARSRANLRRPASSATRRSTLSSSLERDLLLRLASRDGVRLARERPPRDPRARRGDHGAAR